MEAFLTADIATFAFAHFRRLLLTKLSTMMDDPDSRTIMAVAAASVRVDVNVTTPSLAVARLVASGLADWCETALRGDSQLGALLVRCTQPTIDSGLPLSTRAPSQPPGGANALTLSGDGDGGVAALFAALPLWVWLVIAGAVALLLLLLLLLCLRRRTRRRKQQHRLAYSAHAERGGDMEGAGGAGGADDRSRGGAAKSRRTGGSRGGRPVWKTLQPEQNDAGELNTASAQAVRHALARNAQMQAAQTNLVGNRLCPASQTGGGRVRTPSEVFREALQRAGAGSKARGLNRVGDGSKKVNQLYSVGL